VNVLANGAIPLHELTVMQEEGDQVCPRQLVVQIVEEVIMGGATSERDKVSVSVPQPVTEQVMV